MKADSFLSKSGCQVLIRWLKHGGRYGRLNFMPDGSLDSEKLSRNAMESQTETRGYLHVTIKHAKITKLQRHTSVT